MVKIWLPIALLLIFTLPVYAEEEKGILENLCGYVTGEKEVNLSPSAALGEVKEIPGELLAAVAEKIDQGADSLSDKLQEYKKPVPGEGASEEEKVPSTKVLSATAQNAGIDMADHLVVNWKWTLAGLGAVLLVFMFL